MLKYNTVRFVFLSGYAVLKWFLLKFVFIARQNFPIFGFIATNIRRKFTSD